jgi:hypothetical protein
MALHCERPNGNRCLPACGIGLFHSASCPVVPRAPGASLDALHELAWAVVLAGQDDRGNLQPPCIGDLVRWDLLRHAVALIRELGGA